MQTEHAAFKALADPTRRSILKRLSAKELTIAEIAGGYDMTRAAVKKHLTILSDGGLITVRASGRERYNSLNRQGFLAATNWLGWFDAFWDTALDDLKSAVEKEHSND